MSFAHFIILKSSIFSFVHLLISYQLINLLKKDQETFEKLKKKKSNEKQERKCILKISLEV